MTEKKAKTKAKKAVADGVELEAIKHPCGDDCVAELDSGDINPAALETIEVEIDVPGTGPDYHITDAGDILLDTGEPIPEDHPVHPAHRAIAAARKGKK